MPPRPRSSVLPRRASRATVSIPRNGLTCPCVSQSESPRTKAPLSRSFSSSPSHHVTLQRRKMFAWLKGPGKVFRDPLPGSTNYLNAYTPDGKLVRVRQKEAKEVREGGEQSRELAEGEEGENPQEEDLNLATAGKDGKGRAIPRERREDLRPFPDNISFRSEAVLSEELKKRIYDDVVGRGITVREASEKHQVDIRRVGAVVRLKSIEKAWVKEGKPLAKPYASAVMSMLPSTRPGDAHESLNDLPVHASTMTQLFWPVSESRAFTRADAGEAFERGLLPAEKRIPHPQMVRMLNDPTLPTNARERADELQRQMRELDAKAEHKARGKDRKRVQNTTRVHGKRADFCFENVVVNDASVGRTVPGIGTRYGVPNQDRKKGEVKIPRSVE